MNENEQILEKIQAQTQEKEYYPCYACEAELCFCGSCHNPDCPDFESNPDLEGSL